MTSILGQMLEDELAEAKAKAGTMITRKLKNGLRVVLLVRPNDVLVSLWRDAQYPSLQEWDTVMKHFPYATPKIVPTTKQEGSRYIISGTVPSQKMMQLKFG